MSETRRKIATLGRSHALAVALAGTFMAGLDTYIVNLALPTIRHALAISVADIAWVVLAYLLAITAVVITGGRATDLYGARRVFTAGVITFTLGSALAGLAPSLGWLVASRGIQGIGAAMLLAAGQTIVAGLFDEGERGKAFGWLHVAGSAGFAIGPTLGGLLIVQAGWRAVFFVNLPIGILTAIAAQRFLPAGTPRRDQVFDLGGAVTLTLSLLVFVWGLTAGPRQGWFAASVIAALALAALGLVAFVCVERIACQPIVDLRLFRHWPVTAGLLAAFLTFVALASNMFLVPFLLQQVMGIGVARAGLLMIAVPLTILGFAPLSGQLADQIGPRLPATVGLGLVTTAIFLMAGLGTWSTVPGIVIVLALYGAGAGLFQAPNNSAVLGAAPADRRGVTSGMLVMMRQLGQVVGVALATALWTSREDFYATWLPTPAARALGVRDALLGLAVVGLVATVTSWARPQTRRFDLPFEGKV